MNLKELENKKSELCKQIKALDNEIEINKLYGEDNVDIYPQNNERYYALSLSTNNAVNTFSNTFNNVNYNHLINGNYFGEIDLNYAEKIGRKIIAELKLRKWLEINDIYYKDIIDGLTDNVKDRYYFTFIGDEIRIDSISNDYLQYWNFGQIFFSYYVSSIIRSNISTLKPIILDYLMV